MIGEALISGLTKFAFEKSLTAVSKLHDTTGKTSVEDRESLQKGLTIHVQKCIAFAENISTFQLPDKLRLEKHSISLEFTNHHRRFQSVVQGQTLDEIDILNADGHQILLGDPGAGKTTTLKRLTNKTFEILFSDSTNDFKYSFPIVIRLFEIEPHETLLTHICDQLGIQYEVREVEQERTKKKEYFVGRHRLSIALGQYLDDLETIVFLDALDEVNSQVREQVFRDVKDLSNVLKRSKIILSSRYLEEINTFKQFTLNEIKPLSRDQKERIARIWVKNPEVFFNTLEQLPYKDLADRPLFLTYLLRLFSSYNQELPEQPIDVYRQIILLAIREWDDDKEFRIHRFSKYKKFNTYRKEAFLSDIAFELTYGQNVRKRFTYKQLAEAYTEVFPRYRELEFADMKEVLRDIEAHNGLIVELPRDEFEFSHLSLQEFLSAQFLTTIPMPREHLRLLNLYPTPVAIANILSRRPEMWFASLVLTHVAEANTPFKLNSGRLFEYLDRLLNEKIAFTAASRDLGLAVLALFIHFDGTSVIPKLVEFCQTRFVPESLQSCLELYEVTQSGDRYEFKLKRGKDSFFHYSELRLDGEKQGSVSMSSIKHLIETTERPSLK